MGNAEYMGRSNMSSLKITLLPLAICLLLFLNSQVSGKPSPKQFLIETKENAKKNAKDYANIGVNSGLVNDHSRGNFKDYVSFAPKPHPIFGNFKDYANIGVNSGLVNDHSVGNFKDYANIGSNSGVVNDHSRGNFKDYANIGVNTGLVNDHSFGNFAGKK